MNKFLDLKIKMPLDEAQALINYLSDNKYLLKINGKSV
jgi:hypothetical protein